MIRVRTVDHIVLPVADIDRSLAFYHGVLGLPTERLAEFRAGQIGFPSLRVDDRFVIDLFPRGADAPTEGRNLDHFCLVVDAPSIDAVIDALRAADVPMIGTPMPRWGAQGTTMSIYLLDPDGNRLELRTYSPAAMAEAEQRLASQPA